MNRRILFLIAFGITATCCATAAAQDVMWKTYIEAGIKAKRSGDYAKAEKLYRVALREAETFGPQDTRLAVSLNILAMLYVDQKKLLEAEPLYTRAMLILSKTLEPSDPDYPLLADVQNNLALLYNQQQKYTDAETLYKQALAIREKSLGLNNPKVADILGPDQA